MLDEDAVMRLAKKELFEVTDDIDADYEILVQTRKRCLFCHQKCVMRLKRCPEARSRKKRHLLEASTSVRVSFISSTCKVIYSLPGGVYGPNGVEAVFDGAAVQEGRQRRSRTIVLSRLCQYFVKYSQVVCILARIRRTLEEAQPVEQAGFRQNFSTLYHVATCRRPIEASREHRLPLVMTFIDHKKAFDSMEPVKVWEALKEQGVERNYVDVQREC
ncbi:hypothetical protein V3C99_018031 [Haemonchus contortus]|uniref:Reverse transcriptase domain-containing protein n=1 Tax=Haemonchus contortus TaxID=6289 RepID=A0A7I4Z493_HAECO